MSWQNHVRRETLNPVHRQERRSDATPVRCIDEIPKEATPSDVFRLGVEIVRVTERATRSGDPCWFIRCRDDDSITFDVVVWEFQMRALDGKVAEGSDIMLDVRVPKGGYSAFSLA